MVWWILSTALQIYSFIVLVRVILDWYMSIQPDWRPKGFVLVCANAIFAVTDPPLKWLAQWIKPVRVGHSLWDLTPMVLLLVLFVAQRLVVLLPW